MECSLNPELLAPGLQGKLEELGGQKLHPPYLVVQAYCSAILLTTVLPSF